MACKFVQDCNKCNHQSKCKNKAYAFNNQGGCCLNDKNLGMYGCICTPNYQSQCEYNKEASHDKDR